MRLWFRKNASRFEPVAAPPRRWAWLGGGRSIATTPYVLPPDQTEEDRLDLQHFLLTMAAGGLYCAPIGQVQQVLDVGCGTGRWGRDMAHQFPEAQIIGFDVNSEPVERAMERLGPGGQFPINFRFQKADARERFPFDDETFDFVHGRMLSPAIPRDQWPSMVSEMMRVTKRCGHIELVDMRRTPYSSSEAYHAIEQAIAHLMINRGLYVGVGDELAWHLQRAGLRRVRQRELLLGKGRAESREQRLLATDVLAIQANMKALLVKIGAFSDAQFDSIYQQAKTEVTYAGIAMPVVFAFGQKW